jgi:tRNA(Ile)-lysidine synthetase-like protein
VAVATSGGMDSVVLLHVCVELGLQPLVASVDHGLRPASAHELEGVRALAAELGLPFAGHHARLAPGPGASARARDARLSWLASLDVDTVLLAHHRQDQVETVLDRLMRGAGARGLGGIPARRERFARPLLDVDRSDLLAFAQERGMTWVEDPSNRLGTRGGLRHDVLPAMRALRSGVDGAIARTAQHLAQDDALLQDLASALLTPDGVDLATWSAAPVPLQRRALLQLAERAGVQLSAVHVDTVLAGQTVVQAPARARVVRGAERLRVLPATPAPVSGTSVQWGPWTIHGADPVHVRPLASGEQIDGTSARALLRRAGVPTELRSEHPVVSIGARRWLPGVYLEQGVSPRSAEIEARRAARSWVLPGGPYRASL